MSEPGDLSQTIVEEGGPEQETATPENGVIKSESLDEEEKLELQVSLEKSHLSYCCVHPFLSFWRYSEGLFVLLVKSLTSKMNMCNHVQLFETPLTRAPQVPLSMGSSRQEYWSGLPFPPPGDLPDPEIEPTSPHCIGRQILYLWVTWESQVKWTENS